MSNTDPSPEPSRSLAVTLRGKAWNGWREARSHAGFALTRAPGRIGAGLADLGRKLIGKSPQSALRLARALQRVIPRSGAARALAAVLTAREEGWAKAERLFEGGRAAPPAGALLRRRETPGLMPALPGTGTPPGRTVIYTAALGAAPDPAPVFHDTDALPCLCFTDGLERAVPGWEMHPLPGAAPDGAEAATDWCRLHPHLALAEAAPGAGASLWVDPGTRLVGNLGCFVRRWGAGHDLVMWRDALAADWQDLAERRLIEDGPSAAVLAQARALEARALPRNKGAVATNFIWRRHRAPDVVALMEDWAEESRRVPGIPAASLYAVLAEHPDHAAPRILPRALGRAEDNIFAAHVPGRRAPTGRTPARRQVAIVYAKEFENSASTFLRGSQLSKLVARHCAEDFDTRYICETEGLRDTVVVLTKGAIETRSAQEIDALRRDNIAVLASWDDLWPDAAKVAAASANMTLSHRQTVDFSAMFPRTPCFHVTHHINLDIPETRPPQDRFRAGYFGLKRNTYRPESLSRLIDVVGLNTSQVGTSWIDRLPEYNCHWTVRRRARARDGWKPFLKAFVAARCHAVVAIGPEDDDAQQYLGDDYPFYIRSHDMGLLEYDMYALAAAFGGPEWRRALAVMEEVRARSADGVVAAEFRAMVREVSR